jgi:RHS repeat-associated protein
LEGRAKRPGAFTWAPALPSAGTYQIFAKWPGGVSGLASDAVYSVSHTSGVADLTVSQKQGGGTWRYLGAWALDPALAPSVTLKGSLAGLVSADALRFVRQPTSGGVSYILSDQLGQPQKMLDGAGALSWDRIATPFGETAMALGSATANVLRFPGQQYDALTGLHYNYFRDLDPSLGRYPQSDPIGLAGGLNTYAYVGANPVNRIDPTGEILDTIIDAGFILYDLYRIGADNVFGDECNVGENFAALGADVGALFVPFATGGGLAVRGGIKAVDDVGEAAAKALRPNGVPSNWVAQAGQKAGHTKYVNPANPHDYVRVKPDGTITQVRNGKAYDINGNRVSLKSNAAHGITSETFVFRE